jgi:secreted trypsin-like serine protease
MNRLSIGYRICIKFVDVDNMTESINIIGRRYQMKYIPTAAALALCLSLPAHAIVGGTLDSNTADSPWAGVGAVTVNGNTFSGALIGSQYVLTAAHVVNGATPGQVSFVLNAGGGAQTLAVESITVFPGYTGTTPNAFTGVWHDDLAIVKLAAPVSGVPIYSLYGNDDLTTQTITMVGYGATGNGTAGVTAGASPNVKYVGQNRVDAARIDDELIDENGVITANGANEVFVFDFDGPNSGSNIFGNNTPANLTLGTGIEAQYADGDSGSPIFVNDGGVIKLAGVATFNGNTVGLPGGNVLFGAIGGGTIIGSYIPWIQETIAPVPEPGAWLMMLAGLGLLGMKVRRSA